MSFNESFDENLKPELLKPGLSYITERTSAFGYSDINGKMQYIQPVSRYKAFTEIKRGEAVSVVTKQEIEDRAINENKWINKSTLNWGTPSVETLTPKTENGYTIIGTQSVYSITNTVNGNTHNFIRCIKSWYKSPTGSDPNTQESSLQESETSYFKDTSLSEKENFPVKYDYEGALSTFKGLINVGGWNADDIIKLSVSYDLDNDGNVVCSLFAYNKTKVDKIMDDPDPYVVQTNTKIHERTIGLAMEYAEGYDSVIHVQPYGKFIYDPDYENKNNEYYEGVEDKKKSFDHTNKEYNPGFTYRDVGKKVYIKFSEETDGGYGHLTVDEEKTSKHYHNIICLGYLTDAPQKGKEGKTEIEINISGDQRGLLEATQFEATLGEDVVMDSKDPVRVFAIGKESDTNFKARLCFTPQKGTFNNTDFIAFQKMDGKTAIIHFTESFNFNGVIDDDDAAFLHMAKCYADIANNGEIKTLGVNGFNDAQDKDSINSNITNLCGNVDSQSSSVLNTAFKEISGNDLSIKRTYCEANGSPFGYVDIESTKPGGYYAMYISSGLRDKFDGSITTCHGSKENHGKAVLADIRIAERRDLLGIYYGALWDQTLNEGYTTVFMKLGEFDVPEHSQQFDGNFTAGQEYYLGMNGRITKYPYNQYDFVSKIGSIKYGVAGDLRFVVDIGHASRHYNGDLPVGYMKPAVKVTDNEYVAEYGFYLMDGETPHEKAHPNDVLYERLLGWFDKDPMEVSGHDECFKIPKVSRMMPDDTKPDENGNFAQISVPMQIKYLPSGIYEEMPRIPFKRFFGKFENETADNKNLESDNKSWTPVKCFIKDCDITDIVDYGITEDGYTVPGLDNLDIHLFVDPNENYDPAKNKPHDWHEVREGFINWNNTTTFGYTWKIDKDPASKEHPYGCYRLSMDIGKSEGVAYVTADNQAPKKLNGCHYKLYVARREVFARQFDIEKIYKDYLTNSVYTDNDKAVTDRAVTGKAVLDAIENRTSIKKLTAIKDSEIHLGRKELPTKTLELYTKESLPIFSSTDVIITGGQKTNASDGDKVSFEFIEGELKKIHSQTGFTEKNIFTGEYVNNKWTWNNEGIDVKAIPTIEQVRKHAEMRISDHSTKGDIHGMIFGLGGNIDASMICGFKPKNLSDKELTPLTFENGDAYIPLVYKKDSNMFNLDIEGTMSYYISSVENHQGDNITPALTESIFSGDGLSFIGSTKNNTNNSTEAFKLSTDSSSTYPDIQPKKFLGRKYEINDSTRLFAEFYSNGNDKTLISKVLDFENGVLSLQQKTKDENGNWKDNPVGLNIRVGSVEASSRSEYKRIHGETFRNYDSKMFPTSLADGAVQYKDSKKDIVKGTELDNVEYKLESCTNKFKTVLGSALQAAYEMPLAYWQYRTEKEWYKDRLGIIVERVEDVANNIKGKKQATATFGPLTITSKEYDNESITVEFKYVASKESDEPEEEPSYVKINVIKNNEHFDFKAKTVGEAIAKNTVQECPVRFSGVSDSEILADDSDFMIGKPVSITLDNDGKSEGTKRRIFENLVDRNIGEANTTPEAKASCTVGNGLKITAKKPGVEGNNIVVKCTETESSGYKLEVYTGGEQPETTYYCNASASFDEFKTDDAESPVNISDDTLVKFETPDNFKLEPFTAHLVGGTSGDSVSRSLVNTDYQENEFQYTDAEAQSIKEYLTTIIDNSSNGQDVLSTIGLLLKAAQETQERLLKVEASTFGRDYETIPGDHEPYVLKGMPGVVPDPTNYGLNRLIRAICQELYYDSNPFDENLSNNIDDKNRSSFSRIDRLDREIHGELNSEDNVQTAPNTLSEIDSSTYPYDDMIRAEDDTKIREAEFTTDKDKTLAQKRGTGVKTRVDMSLYEKDSEGYYKGELDGNTVKHGEKDSTTFNGIVDAIYRITTKLNALTESINNSDNIADAPVRLNTIRQNIEHLIREAYFDDAYVINVVGDSPEIGLKSSGEKSDGSKYIEEALKLVPAEPYHDLNGKEHRPYTKNLSRFDKLTDDLYNYTISLKGEAKASFQNFYAFGDEKVLNPTPVMGENGKVSLQDTNTQVYYTGRKFNGKHLLLDNNTTQDGTTEGFEAKPHIPQNLNDYNYATLLDIVVDALGDEFFRKNVSEKAYLDDAWNNRQELRHNKTISERLDEIEKCLDKVVGKLSRGHSFEEEKEAFDLGKSVTNTDRKAGTLNEPYSNVFSIDRYLQFMNDYLGYSQTTTNNIEYTGPKSPDDGTGNGTSANYTQAYTEHWANGYDYKIFSKSDNPANQGIDDSTDTKEPEYSAEWALTHKKKIHAGLVNMLSRIQNEETRSDRYDAILGPDFSSYADKLSTKYTDFNINDSNNESTRQERKSTASYNLTDDIQDLLKTIYGVDNHNAVQPSENGAFTDFIHRTEVQKDGNSLAERFTEDSGGAGGNNIIDVMINEMYYLPQPLRPVESDNSDELTDKVRTSLGNRLVNNLNSTDTVSVYIPTESTLHEDTAIKDSRAAKYYDFDSGINVYDIDSTEKALSWNNRDEFFNSIGRFNDVDVKTKNDNGTWKNKNNQLHSRLSRFDVIENEIRSLRRLIGLDFDHWDGEEDLTELKFDGILKFFGGRVNNGFSGNPFPIDVGASDKDSVTDQFNASAQNNKPTQTSILRFLLNADKSERLLRTELGFSDGYNKNETYGNSTDKEINGYWYWYDPEYNDGTNFVGWGKSENYNDTNLLENYGLYKQKNTDDFMYRHSVYDRLLALEKNAVQVDAWLDSVKNIYRNNCGNGTGKGNIFDIVNYLGNYTWNNTTADDAARYYGSFGKLDLDNITIEKYNETTGGNTNYDTVTEELNEHHKALQNIYDVIGIDSVKDENIVTYVGDTSSNRKYPSEDSTSIVPKNKTLWARLNAVEELNQHDLDITNVITVNRTKLESETNNHKDGVINLTDGKSFPTAEYKVLDATDDCSLVTKDTDWEAGKKELIASKGYVDNKIVEEINRYAKDVDVGDEISATVKIDKNVISNNQPSQTSDSSESSGTGNASEPAQPSTSGNYNDETNSGCNKIQLDSHMYLSGKPTEDFKNSTEQKQNYYNAFTIDGLIEAINRLNEQNQKNVNNLYKNVNNLMNVLQYSYNADNNIQTTTGSLLSFVDSTTPSEPTTTDDNNENSSGGSGSEGSTIPADSSNDSNGENSPKNNNSGSSSGNQGENQEGTEQQNTGDNGGTDETGGTTDSSDSTTDDDTKIPSDDNKPENTSGTLDETSDNTEQQDTGGTTDMSGSTTTDLPTGGDNENTSGDDNPGSTTSDDEEHVDPEESTRDSEGGDEPKNSDKEPPSGPNDNQ